MDRQDRTKGNEECADLLQVYLRVKPGNTDSNVYKIENKTHLSSLDTTTAGHGRRTQHASKMYTFSHIFGPESNQQEIFEHVVKDSLKKLPEGNSFTLLTYGASGSGKTFTLMGTVAAPGLVPRSLEYIFKVVEAAQTPTLKPSGIGAEKLSYAEQNYELQWVKKLRQISAPLRDRYRRMNAQLLGDLTSSNIDLSNRTRHYVWVSFIEIYNESMYDLLAADRRTASKLTIREDASGNVYVKGAVQAFVRSGEEAYDIMVAGKHNLHVAATGINAKSSRSHCIFTITMVTETSGGVRCACMRLCDLAGCERAARTGNTGARLNESRAINSSLHVLERCLRTLRNRRGAHVPYRESKLTRLLGAGLSGARGEAVSMVVTLNPAPAAANETRHVLQLAAVVRNIPIKNTISDYPSSLTTQETTCACSSAVMKLERLELELIQAQASMEQNQAKVKEIWRQVQALKTECMADRAILEENISAERQARARVEERLRACSDERDEKAEDENEERKNSADETDPCNESLEPILTKEDINRSRVIRQSLIDDMSFTSERSENIFPNETSYTTRDDRHDKDCTYETSEYTVREIGSNRDVIDPVNDNNVLNEDKINKSIQEDAMVKGNSCKITYSVNNPDITGDSFYYSICSDDQSMSMRALNSDVSKDSLLEKKIGDFSNVNNESDNSLALFERLELAANAYNSDDERVDNQLTEFKVVKEKRNNFDEETTNKSPKTPATVTKSKEKKFFFD